MASRPTLEWCPPGHGDIYTALVASGVLDALLERGFRYASMTNGDNLGAAPNATLAGWFAASGARTPPRCRRARSTAARAVIWRSARPTGSSSCATPPRRPDQMEFFTDEFRHPYFHTNNLWIDLTRLKQTLADQDNVLGLPLIRNDKTIRSSRPV